MDLEAEYNNRVRFPGHEKIIAKWAEDAAVFRRENNYLSDQSYGLNQRQSCDIFLPESQMAEVICVFIHGGYWQALDKSYFSHLAQSVLPKGIAMAVPSYRLCPQVAITDIIEDMQNLCLWLYRKYQKPLVVAGHSAGGHLAACLFATDWTKHDAPEKLVRAGMGISGVYDLRPLLPISINERLQLDAASALCASPLFWALPAGGRFEAWVGAQESPEFLRQNETLAAAWQGVGIEINAVARPGKDHFTVINDLADPASDMSQVLRDLALGS